MRKMIFFLSFFCAALAVSSVAVGIEVKAEVDKDKVFIGDNIKLDVTVEEKDGMSVVLPDTFGSPGDFVFKESRLLKPGKNRTGREYILGVYTTGTHVIPPVEIKYRDSSADIWDLAQTRQIPIYVKSALKGDEKDIRALKGILPFGTGMPVKILVITALVAAAVLFALKRKKGVFRKELIEDCRLPHEIAYDSLTELYKEDLPSKGLVKEYYFRLSGIIRYYLEGRLSYRVPEMTTEEFLNSLKRSSDLDDESKKQLKEFLEKCDIVKFAKYGPTPIEIIDSFKLAKGIVDKTKVMDKEEDK